MKEVIDGRSVHENMPDDRKCLQKGDLASEHTG